MTESGVQAPAAYPLGSDFLVLPDERETVTEAGVENPSAEAKTTGTVVVVGTDCYLEPGMRVQWIYHPTQTLDIEGVTYYLMDSDSVAVVLVDDLVPIIAAVFG